MVFGCFRSCCWTVLCGHSWEVPPKLERAGEWRWEGRGSLGFFVEFSATRKGPEMSHHQKQLLFSSVSHQASTPSLSHLPVTPFQPFLVVSCILNLPFAGFSPFNGQSQGWLRHFSCVCSPKTQCKLLAVISSQLSASPARSRSWLWNFHCGNAAQGLRGNFSWRT